MWTQDVCFIASWDQGVWCFVSITLCTIRYCVHVWNMADSCLTCHDVIISVDDSAMNLSCCRKSSMVVGFWISMKAGDFRLGIWLIICSRIRLGSADQCIVTMLGSLPLSSVFSRSFVWIPFSDCPFIADDMGGFCYLKKKFRSMCHFWKAGNYQLSDRLVFYDIM